MLQWQLANYQTVVLYACGIITLGGHSKTTEIEKVGAENSQGHIVPVATRREVHELKKHEL